MKLHIKSPGQAPGLYPICVRRHDLQHLSFTIVELGGDLRRHTFESGEEELSLGFHTGPVRVEVEGASGAWSAEIPPRETITRPGSLVYVPAGSRVTLAALDGPARIILAGAAGRPDVSPVLVAPEQAVKKIVGRDNWQRTVYTQLAANVEAAHLLVGETVNQPGGWSGWPAHKHDCFAPPSEVPMEEIYYFRVEPPQGFGIIRVYTEPDDREPFDYAFAVEDGDTVLVPRGYHPVVAGPGYTLNFTWIMAGAGRTWGAWSEDPRHTWIKAA